MTRRRTWPLVLALVVAVVCGAVLLDPAARILGWVGGEPFFQGHSATAWERDLKQKDEAGRAAAVTALVQGKGDAIPVCVWLLQRSADPTVRFRAAEALGQMGKDAAPAAGPALLAAIDDKDPTVREVVIAAIGRLAPDVPGAVPALVRAFPKDLAIKVVPMFGPAAAEAVPALISLLKHSDPNVRWNAAAALGELRQAALPAVPGLVELLETDKEPVVREHAAEALAQIGPKVAENPKVVPALIKALTDSNQRVRWNAGRALGKIGGPALPAVPGLVEQLEKDNDPLVREHAAESLGQIGPKAAAENSKVVPALAKALKDTDQRVRRDAVRSLGQIGAAAKPVLADVKALLNDPVERVKTAAKEAVRRIEMP